MGFVVEFVLLRVGCFAPQQSWQTESLYQDNFLDAPKELIEDRAHAA